MRMALKAIEVASWRLGWPIRQVPALAIHETKDMRSIQGLQRSRLKIATGMADITGIGRTTRLEKGLMVVMTLDFRQKISFLFWLIGAHTRTMFGDFGFTRPTPFELRKSANR